MSFLNLKPGDKVLITTEATVGYVSAVGMDVHSVHGKSSNHVMPSVTQNLIDAGTVKVVKVTKPAPTGIGATITARTVGGTIKQMTRYSSNNWVTTQGGFWYDNDFTSGQVEVIDVLSEGTTL